MERPIDLSKIDLGAPAAERDIQRGLEYYFVDSDAYRRVQNRNKIVVIGNRGAGKSAIFQMIAARSRKRYGANTPLVIELAPEDYSYELLRTALMAESEGSWAKLGAYSVAWKYLLYVLVMQSLVEAGGGKPGRGALARITAYIRDNHPTVGLSKLSAMIGYLKRLEGIKVGPVEASLKTRELEKLYKLAEIRDLLPSLAEALKRQPVLVFVDELDRGWDASEDAQAFVAGLFQACVTINGLSDSLTVYMSLRQELYDNIPALYDDAQKYRDLIETVSWNEDGLRRMIAERLRHSVPALRHKSDKDCWNAVFSETLSYRQSNSFNYMVDRTLYRPREMIEFTTKTIEYAVAGGMVPPLDYSVIAKAEASYSEDRTKDIAAEYRFQYPGLLSVFEVFRGRPYTIDRDSLQYLCLEMAMGEVATSLEASTWIEGIDPSSLIEVLWQVGFLRAQAVGGIKAQRRSGSSYLGSHQVGNLPLVNIQRFQIHQVFRLYLGLKEPKATADK